MYCRDNVTAYNTVNMNLGWICVHLAPVLTTATSIVSCFIFTFWNNCTLLNSVGVFTVRAFSLLCAFWILNNTFLGLINTSIMCLRKTLIYFLPFQHTRQQKCGSFWQIYHPPSSLKTNSNQATCKVFPKFLWDFA